MCSPWEFLRVKMLMLNTQVNKLLVCAHLYGTDEHMK